MLDRQEMGAGLFSRLGEDGEEDGGENRDDGDHNEQFNQGEAAGARLGDDVVIFYLLYIKSPRSRQSVGVLTP